MLYIDRLTIVPIQALPALQFLAFARGDGINLFLRSTQVLHDTLIDYTHAAAGDGPDGELFLARSAQFLHNDNVEWSIQCLGHRVSDGYASARKRQDHNVGPVGILAQILSQDSPCLYSVAKDHLAHPPSQP